MPGVSLAYRNRKCGSVARTRRAILLVDVVGNENPSAVVCGGVSRDATETTAGRALGLVNFAINSGNCWFLHPPSFDVPNFIADSPSMKKIIRFTDKLTYSIPTSPTQTRCLTRARHRVTPPNPSTALPSPSFPTCHGSLAPIHSPSKGSLMHHARRWIRKNITKRCRCMSFARFMLRLLT